MNQFHKIILSIIFFIISSVFPFYYLFLYDLNLILMFIFSIWIASNTLILSYVVTDNRKLLFIFTFWIIIFVFCFIVEKSLSFVDPMLYGVVYGAFFIMCGSILYKWKIEIHDRLEVFLFGYLFQGVYDWIWWIVQYFDPNHKTYQWNDPFYVDLIFKNSTIKTVFFVEILNLFFAIILVFYYKKNNWNFLFFCSLWIILQLNTIILSYYNINIIYDYLYIIYIMIFLTFYLIRKELKRDELIRVKKL